MDPQPVRKTVTLVVTQNCNLSCSYCYESNKADRKIPLSLAVDIVTKYLSNETDAYDECVIDLFGGEPFLNFSLIKQICEYVWSNNWNKPYLFATTTNGTLVHGQIQEWLYQNRERFSVTLSLDGTREMHDINRSNSYSRIDLPFFRNTWPNSSVKMTLSEETLPNLAEGVIFLHSLGFSIENNLAYGVNWSDPRNIELLERELKKLAEFYIMNSEIQPCSLMNMKIGFAWDSGTTNKWCGVGTHMIAFDVDGQSYPCHAFMPISCGGEKALRSKSLVFEDADRLLDPMCSGCVIHPICPTCYGSNYLMRDNIAKRDEALCRLTKVRALACSFLEAKKILAKTGGEPVEGKDYLSIKSILEIQNRIDI